MIWLLLNMTYALLMPYLITISIFAIERRQVKAWCSVSSGFCNLMHKMQIVEISLSSTVESVDFLPAFTSRICYSWTRVTRSAGGPVVLAIFWFSLLLRPLFIWFYVFIIYFSKSFQIFSASSLEMMNFRQGLLLTSRTLYTSSSIMAPTLALDNMNPCIKKMEYAVRGPLVIRATAIEKVQRPSN